jgi:GNAT superfamily N-acetyltransferase
MSPIYKLKDYKETFIFEKEHPKELRWDDKYKLYMLLEDKRLQGIWLRDNKTELVAEMLLSWQSTNVLHIESFTVLPSHQGKGLGHDLVKLAIEWGTNSGYEFLTGEARQGASWKIFENFGASPIFLYKNWNGTKEDYMSFKLEL